LSNFGLQWSKLQWLVAALGVGLGFGLQEIVANFVSGIILLLERPIRIGDTVELGDAGGTVARIQIRATTLVTWERKELLVPNKEFITGRVLNWTLSNEQTRILINVGVAYGSDVGKAMELIMQAAKEHKRVLDDPQPIVTFEAFGDNALSVFLRAYTDSIDFRLTTMTELHQAIYDKLNAAGIAIAFPQRDVHLDTAKPLEITLHQEPAER
jgi:potassium efflux system protein